MPFLCGCLTGQRKDTRSILQQAGTSSSLGNSSIKVQHGGGDDLDIFPSPTIWRYFISRHEGSPLGLVFNDAKVHLSSAISISKGRKKKEGFHRRLVQEGVCGQGSDSWGHCSKNFWIIRLKFA